jgi:hypothetical protein
MRAAVVALALLAASPALAQDLGDALGDPSDAASGQPNEDRPTRRRSRPRRAGLGLALSEPSIRAVARPRVEPPQLPWVGPQVQLAYSFYRLSDGYGGGDVNAAEIEAFIQFPVSELRLGVLGSLGARDYSLGGDDLVMRAAIEVGFQLTNLLEPFVPHLSFLISFGGLIGERFETTVAHAFGGAGLALGGEVRIIRGFHLGIEGAYLRLEMDGAAFDVVMLRIALGL